MVMGQRFHRGFTAAEKTELWDRWKRGESLKAIGRAFGKQSSSIYFLVAPQDESHRAEPPENKSTMTPYQKLSRSPSATPRASSDPITPSSLPQ